MIAKRVLRGRAGDFGRLGEYIVRGQKPESGQAQVALAERTTASEAAIWQRTADYILDAVHGGERVAAVRITNCAADDIESAITEIVALQSRNQRARGDRTYHLVVSFPPGEKPPIEVLHDIEDELCKAIGLGRHQRISAVHADTQHLHMHIAINQVHPETLACIEPWQDRPKLMRACERLEIKHGLTRTNHGKAKAVAAEPGLPLRADAMERQGGLTSLAGWIRREAQAALLDAVETGQGWQDLHAALQEYGLEMRPRGAGLVIVERGTGLRVKASSIDLELSARALERRWGAYVRPDLTARVEPVKARQSYRRGPMHRGVDELFEDWQRLWEDRRVAVSKLRDEIRERGVWRQTWFRNSLDNTSRYALSRADSEMKISQLRVERSKLIQEDSQWADEQFRVLNQQHRVPSWLDYLRDAASQGNASALRALRRNTNRYRQAVDAVASGDAGNPMVVSELRPETLGNGDVVYLLRDGGKVVDGSQGVTIERESSVAIALTLAIAAARSPAREVDVANSTPERQRAMIEIAARDKMDLRFANAGDEQERVRLIGVFEREDVHLAATVFVAGRNAAQSEQPDLPAHRFWTDADAGAATFEGLQPLGEGAQALLLRKGDEILVLPMTAAEASALPAHTPGEPVEVSPARQIERGQQR